MTQRIVLLDLIPADRAEQLRALLPPGFSLDVAAGADEADRRRAIADADYAIAGQVPVDAALLAAAPRLKLLHKWGVGVDNFDLDAARARGLPVARTTGGNATPVAEFALSLILGLLRGAILGHAQLKGGRWRGFGGGAPESVMLSGRTVGIVGFGAIGQRLASLLRGFECRILYAQRRDAPEAEALGAIRVPLPELLAASDVVSLHCPLTPQTQGLIDARALDAMKRSAYLINTARGGVVVEADLVAALRQRRIAGAALDVYDIEPLPADNPLLSLDNCVVTPHLAALAADNVEPNVRRIFENIARVSRGEPLPERDRVV